MDGLSAEIWQSVALTIKLASATTVILLIIGTPLAWWLARSKAIWTEAVATIVALPLVLPPTVLGFYLLVAFAPRAPLGRGFAALLGHPLAFSFEGLLLASVLYSLPFAVQPFAAALSRVDPRLVEASYALGAGRLETFFRVSLPLARPGVVAGAVLAFAHTIGEFGVVLMVGGNVPGQTRTLSIALFDAVEQLDWAAAHRTSLVLLALSFAALVATHALQPRSSTSR